MDRWLRERPSFTLKIVFDIEANSLVKPTHIWVIVCKDIDTGNKEVFRNVTELVEEKERFLAYAANVTLWIGHNVLGYDLPVLRDLLQLDVPVGNVIDTLVISHLADYPRKKHSIASYGEEFGMPKIEFNNFKQYSQEMEDYCVRDVDIAHKVYSRYIKYISNPAHLDAITLEQDFECRCVRMHSNGFAFDHSAATALLLRVEKALAKVDEKILKEFPPKLKMIREITPKETKYGTLSKSDFRWVTDGDLSDYNGGPFCRCSWVAFNPSSHKQVVSVLNQAGWKPTEKTQTHINVLREITAGKRPGKTISSIDLAALSAKLLILEKSGWQINEVNLDTLPSSAPPAARSLAKRILLESRRRTLTEWLGLYNPDTQRIHGEFHGIGAWTHRMAHRRPNTANIPNEFEQDGSRKLLGKELRALWRAPKNRLLVGVDAEGIQLRIFAHYIDDPEFTKALVDGKKENKSDPHSLNKSILGEVCKTRQAAKRFIYALLLGGGIGKLAHILECSVEQAREALDKLSSRYTGFEYVKSKIIPSDAKRGWFVGLDGRKVRLPGDGVGERRHLAMSGYLQNGESIIMKRACAKWEGDLARDNAMLVDFVHDEWQVECPNDMGIATRLAAKMSDSLREVGEELNLKCPLAGSYWNDDHKDYTIGVNWSVTH